MRGNNSWYVYVTKSQTFRGKHMVRYFCQKTDWISSLILVMISVNYEESIYLNYEIFYTINLYILFY